MMRYGKPLKPLNVKIDGLYGASGSSTKKFKEDYEKAEKKRKMDI